MLPFTPLTRLHLSRLLLGVLPSSAPVFPFSPPHTDCVEAHRVCSADPPCKALYRGLELCAADAAVSPLGEQAASECLERRDALLAKHPSLWACKCQRGFRKEEQCLRIYWGVRLLPGEPGLRGGRIFIAESYSHTENC
uniref:GDNF/GAS1 domain-containing protein n=1 Tax=Acanthochromis polyacanthus TaxID=80966 RepID=A0A3Q1F8B9_9TELE